MLSAWPSSSAPRARSLPGRAARPEGVRCQQPGRPGRRVAPRPRATGNCWVQAEERPPGAVAAVREEAAGGPDAISPSGGRCGRLIPQRRATSTADHRSSAIPRQSKPGPRLAEVAGARTVILCAGMAGPIVASAPSQAQGGVKLAGEKREILGSRETRRSLSRAASRG